MGEVEGTKEVVHEWGVCALHASLAATTERGGDTRSRLLWIRAEDQENSPKGQLTTW